jgi:hypothetical protein
VIRILNGPFNGLGLEAEAESELATKRGVFRRGDACPSSNSITVAFIAVNALEVLGRESSMNTLAIVEVEDASADNSQIT